MNAVARNKLSHLERILASHAAMEKRVLADLRRVGFKFRTVGQAYETLRAQRTLTMFTAEQIDLAVRVLGMKEGKK